MYESIITTLNRVKKKLILDYRSKGLKASGNFERGLDIGRQGRYKVVLSIPSYSRYIMKFKGNTLGRGPGKFPPMDVIQQWVKDKGLRLRDLGTGRFRTRSETANKQIAFLIGRKIAQEGTDIYQGKRQPIDLDAIVENEFDFAGEEIADRILEIINI